MLKIINSRTLGVKNSDSICWASCDSYGLGDAVAWRWAGPRSVRDCCRAASCLERRAGKRRRWLTPGGAGCRAHRRRPQGVAAPARCEGESRAGQDGVVACVVQQRQQGLPDARGSHVTSDSPSSAGAPDQCCHPQACKPFPWARSCAPGAA